MVSLHQKGHCKVGESSKRTTKFILRTDVSYADCLKKVNLLSLEKRRLLPDLTFFAHGCDVKSMSVVGSPMALTHSFHSD